MAGTALSQESHNDKSRTYRTFNPTIDNPVDRLDDALVALDFLAMAADKTASDFPEDKMDGPEQRGFAHLLRLVRRELNDVAQFLDDQGVDRLVKCHPRRERKDEGLAVLSMVTGLAARKDGGSAEGSEASQV